MKPKTVPVYSYKCGVCRSSIRLPYAGKIAQLWCSFCNRKTPHTCQ